MREAKFRTWLEVNGYDAATIGTQLARAKRIEQNYGDLDVLFNNGKLKALKVELSYSTDDERAGRPNPAKFPINGSIRKSMASYCSTIEYYSKFCDASTDENLPERQGQLAAVNFLVVENIIATMDQCDAVGVDQFLRPFGFVRPSRWVLRPDSQQRYPAKATVAIALGRLPQGKSLTAKEFFGGFGEAQAFAKLKELGFEVIGKEVAEPSFSDAGDAKGEAERVRKHVIRQFIQPAIAQGKSELRITLGDVLNSMTPPPGQANARQVLDGNKLRARLESHA